MGVVLHPLSITRKTFGYADYPEISFRLPYLSDTSNFRDNSAIECFIDGEESVKGVLLSMDGQKGEFRLFAPDFPDWIEDKRAGIKLSPDHFTSETMKKAVKNITAQKEVEMLFECIHGKASFGIKSGANVTIDFQNKTLNESQQLAVKGIVFNDNLAIVHGPPGTVKTTTLIEAIVQSVKLGKRILVTASSNTAVDNVAKGLLDKEIDILRVGNTLKVDDDIFSSTPEGKMQEAKELK